MIKKNILKLVSSATLITLCNGFAVFASTKDNVQSIVKEPLVTTDSMVKLDSLQSNNQVKLSSTVYYDSYVSDYKTTSFGTGCYLKDARIYYDVGGSGKYIKGPQVHYIYLSEKFINKLERTTGNGATIAGLLGLSVSNNYAKVVIAAYGITWGRILYTDDGDGVTLYWNGTATWPDLTGNPTKVLSGKNFIYHNEKNPMVG